MDIGAGEAQEQEEDATALQLPPCHELQQLRFTKSNQTFGKGWTTGVVTMVAELLPNTHEEQGSVAGMLYGRQVEAKASK